MKRESSSWLYAFLFFCILISLVPIAFHPDAPFLKTYFSGYIWIAALLSSLLSTQYFFMPEHEDGFLEQLLFHEHQLILYIYAKLTAHWLGFFIPLLILTPVLGILIGLSAELIAINMACLLLATPVLILINAFGSALTHELSAQSGLISIITLPLVVPIFIFAIKASRIAEQNGDPSFLFALMGALLITCASTIPFAMGYVLKLVMRH